MPDKSRAGELLSAAEASEMVAIRVAELGGLPPAGKRWKISPQMVHMVVRQKRRLTATMLKDLRLIAIHSDVQYRRLR